MLMLLVLSLLLVPTSICLVFGHCDAEQRTGTTGHHPRSRLDLQSRMTCPSRCREREIQ